MTPGATNPQLAKLTPRQRDVIRCLCTGVTCRQAGPLLGISSRTVEVHLAEIKARLGATTKLQAILIAYGVDGQEPLV